MRCPNARWPYALSECALASPFPNSRVFGYPFPFPNSRACLGYRFPECARRYALAAADLLRAPAHLAVVCAAARAALAGFGASYWLLGHCLLCVRACAPVMPVWGHTLFEFARVCRARISISQFVRVCVSHFRIRVCFAFPFPGFVQVRPRGRGPGGRHRARAGAGGDERGGRRVRAVGSCGCSCARCVLLLLLLGGGGAGGSGGWGGGRRFSECACGHCLPMRSSRACSSACAQRAHPQPPDG